MQFTFPSIFRLKSLWPGLHIRYERVAQNWHSSVCKLGYVQAYGALIAAAKPHFPTPNGMEPLKVLDAGCGSGAFSLALCNQTTSPLSIHLLDNSQNMLDEAQYNTLASQPHPLRQICANIETIASQEQSYDVILCAHVIDHLPDPVATLVQLRRTLAPNGIIILAVSKPHWCTSLVQLRWHHNAYAPKQVSELLLAAGFSAPTLFPFPEGPPKFTSHGYIANSPSKR